MTRLAESVAVAAGGAAIGAVVGAPIGLPIPFAAVAAGNGAISGWRGIYEWNRPRGVVAFVLDSSWALITTAAGLVSHVLGEMRGRPGYSAELSRRQNRHVYERGFQPRKGFATTLGNVVTAVLPAPNGGFTMQMPDALASGDTATSNAVLVFTGATPAVAVGDVVDVRGQVVEFNTGDVPVADALTAHEC